MAQQMVHASIDLDSSLHLVFLPLILCFVKPKGGSNCPDRQHICHGSRFCGHCAPPPPPPKPLFENLSSLGGVLIKFFSDSWKHGYPGDFFWFEIFDFGIVLGRLILAAATVSLLYCAGILGSIQN